MDEYRYKSMLEHPPTGTTLKKNYLNQYGVGLTISFFVFFAIASPFIFGKTDGILSGFLDSGQIGDTVGGLTAPIIGILNAILLWWTLRKQGHVISEQNLQNRIERKRDKLDELLKVQSLNIRETGSHTFTNYQGMELVFVLIDFFSHKIKAFGDSEIRHRDWNVYMLHLSDIMKTATDIANLNLVKKDSFEDKIYLFVEINEQMNKIFALVALIQKYNERINENQIDIDPASPHHIPRYIYKFDMFRTLFASRDPAALWHSENKRKKSLLERIFPSLKWIRQLPDPF